ncbi:MAG: phage tail protein [Vogesella sp.]|uniref:phage tail protein n=1 Tax=Vogesella sp. TaxID=1904252 RepID=UPI0039189C28
MNLPHHLRAALEAALPQLKQNPDRLLMFIEAGGLTGASLKTLSFRYRYTLTLVFVDFSGHMDEIMVPLLAWLQQYQPDLIQNGTAMAEKLKFEAELTSHNQCDIELRIPLNEGVTVTQKDGNTIAQHLDSVNGTNASITINQLLLNGEIVSGQPD